MKTLKELITEGLPVGALVKDEARVYQVVQEGKDFVKLFDPKGKLYSFVHKSKAFQPTTAYDSDIDPETLPIPEPFWTGFVASLSINPVPIQAETTELFYIDTDGSSVYKSDCQPCLQPT